MSLTALKPVRRMLLGVLTALAVNVIGNWVLVPRFGYAAASYVALGSAVVYLLFVAAVTPLAALRKFVAEKERELEPRSSVLAEPITAWKAPSHD